MTWAMLLTGDPSAIGKSWDNVIRHQMLDRAELNSGRLVIIHGDEFPAELVADRIAGEDHWRFSVIPIPGNAPDRRETSGVATLAALQAAGYRAEVVIFHAYLDRDPAMQAIAKAALDRGLDVRQVIHAQDTGTITTPTGRIFAAGDRRRGPRKGQERRPPKRRRRVKNDEAHAAVYREALQFLDDSARG